MKANDSNMVSKNQRIIYNPKYRYNKNKNVTILRIVINESYTRIDILYCPINKFKPGKWIQINQMCLIRPLGTDETMQLIHAENIPISPEKNFFKSKFDMLSFSLYFPPIPEGTMVFDLIEYPKNDLNNFNFYCINLNTPKHKPFFFKN